MPFASQKPDFITLFDDRSDFICFGAEQTASVHCILFCFYLGSWWFNFHLLSWTGAQNHSDDAVSIFDEFFTNASLPFLTTFSYMIFHVKYGNRSSEMAMASAISRWVKLGYSLTTSCTCRWLLVLLQFLVVHNLVRL